MKREIRYGNSFCAVLEDGKLVEYLRTDGTDRSGDILLGRIDRIMSGMNCAFVRIGRKKDGFLPLNEDSGSFTGGSVRSGETVILQIKKEETGGKGAFLTRDVTLAGRYTILMPMNRYIGVSSRITDDNVRDSMKDTGRKIAGGRFGLVMRNAAAQAKTEEIRDEAEQAWLEWQHIAEQADRSGKAGTVLRSGNAINQLKTDYASGGIDEITETEEPGQEIRRQLREAMERKVSIPCGANIVIDRCEAMTVIDVNTASVKGSGNKEHTVLETNMQACEAIARQVRLRNLSGIILIDFIDMEKETDRSLVQNCLEEWFSRDRIKTVIHGWTTLGLMEMTRKRTRPGLYETALETCAACGGRGSILRESEQ